MDRRLPRDVIKSRGVRGKGAKVEGGGHRRVAGEKSAPKKLGVADQRGTKGFALGSGKGTFLTTTKMKVR